MSDVEKLKRLRKRLKKEHNLVLNDELYDLSVSLKCYLYEDFLNACRNIDNEYLHAWLNMFNLTIRAVPAKMLDSEFYTLEIIKMLRTMGVKNVG
jgi:hypothetical protein